MRKLVTLAVSTAILAGSYFIAFGVPASIGVLSGAETAVSSEAGISSGGPEGGGPPGMSEGGNATTVVLSPLEMRPYENILRSIGSASARRSVYITANVSGDVTEINLAANQQVTIGDVLVQLDARTEVFNLEIAQTNLDQARETVQRYERLRGSGNSTITDVNLSDAMVAQRLAEANLGLAQAALDDRTIRAPISGKLGLSEPEIGDVLSANTAVVTIDDSEALLVEFELTKRSIGR